MRLVFAGTPEFGAVALARLIEDGHDLRAVYTQPDRPAGRGRRLRASPVKGLALASRIPLEQPASLKSPEAVETLHRYRPDVMVVAAYGLILPPAVLAVPALGCVNIHASLLPRWRGAAPIQHAIMAGDEVSGVTIMQMDAGLDTGDILAVRRCPVQPHDTGGTLHDRLAALGADAISETLPRLAAGAITPCPQDDAEATYAARITKAEAEIDWAASAVALERRVRAFDPWPVATTCLLRAGQAPLALRIWRASAVLSGAVASDAAPGTVLVCGRAGIEVATGAGGLRLERVQRAGGRPVDTAAFLNAVAVAPGDRLGPAP